jgi:hypothetical protein
MSRAGVPSDIAERVLGHAIGGVRAVYDRHDFLVEKADALEKLAALVDRIINSAENREATCHQEGAKDKNPRRLAGRPLGSTALSGLPSPSASR